MAWWAFGLIWLGCVALICLGWYALRGGPRRDALDRLDDEAFRAAQRRRAAREIEEYVAADGRRLTRRRRVEEGAWPER